MARRRKKIANSGPIAPRTIKPAELVPAQQTLGKIMGNTIEALSKSSTAVHNIYGTNVVMPTLFPLAKLHENTAVFQELANIGLDALGNIEHISERISTLAKPETDIYEANEIITAILWLIGNNWTSNIAASLWFGYKVSRHEQTVFEAIMAGTRAAGDARAFQTFSKAFPPALRQLFLDTARTSERIRITASQQRDKAANVRTRMETDYNEDLLPGYARRIKEAKDKIPSQNKARIDASEQIGKEAAKENPDPGVKESTLVGATTALIDTMRELMELRNSYLNRGLGVVANSDLAVSSETVYQSTGGRALRHINMFGVLLILQFLRTITTALVTAAVSLGGQDADALKEYWAATMTENEVFGQLTSNL